MRIQDIDKNFAVNDNIENLEFFDVCRPPFTLYGFCQPQAPFRRLPAATAAAVSDGVAALSLCTAGGRVRFRTNSSRIAIRALMPRVDWAYGMAFAGAAGFDLYICENEKATFHHNFPPDEGCLHEKGCTGVIQKPPVLQDIIINFPLYAAVDALYIGLEKGAVLEAGGSYAAKKPIVYYGSSITQGGCASRPGTCYTAIVARRLGMDHINLGFSGCAKGEDAIAAYIASLPMSLFVYDYDHNAPNPAHLAATHERMFRTIRAKNPLLPILMLSAPNADCDPQEYAQRREVVFKTYQNAVDAGDKNVFFINGATLFGTDGRDDCTVDSVHPTDLGFYRMAQAVLDCVLHNVPRAVLYK